MPTTSLALTPDLYGLQGWGDVIGSLGLELILWSASAANCLTVQDSRAEDSCPLVTQSTLGLRDMVTNNIKPSNGFILLKQLTNIPDNH